MKNKIDVMNMGFVKYSAIVIGIYYTGLLMIAVKPIAVPLVMAIFFAFLFIEFTLAIQSARYFVNFFGAKLMRILSIPLSLIAVGGTFTGIFIIINQNVHKIAAKGPFYKEQVMNEIGPAILGIREQLPENIASQIQYDVIVDKLIDISFVASSIGNAASGIASQAFIVFLLFAFILADYKNIGKKIDKIDSNETVINLRSVISSVNEKVKKYIVVKTCASAATGILCYAGLKILNVDFAALWGVLIFLLNYIPNIGSLISAIPVLLMAIVMYGISIKFILVGGLLFMVNIFIGSIIEPKFMGKALNLSPLAIIISLMGFGIIWGTTGAFFCVIITAVLHQVMAEFPETRSFAILISAEGNIGEAEPAAVAMDPDEGKIKELEVA